MKRPIIVAAVLLFAAACTGDKKADDNNKQPVTAPPAQSAPPPAPAPSVAPTPIATAVARVYEIPDESKKVFTQRCALCHGKGGMGDGAGGRGMKPPPQNWTDPAWGALVTDEQIATAIVKGGAGVGKSSTMPPNPDLEGGFKQPVVDGLVHMVRSFAAAAAPSATPSAAPSTAPAATHP
jgi:mono/diheme cytochrome c family protein